MVYFSGRSWTLFQLLYTFYIPNTYPVNWSFDPNILRKMSYNIGGHDYRSISLSAKNVSSVITTKLRVTTEGGTREKEISIIPSSNIILGSDYVISGKEERYYIQNLPSGATVISWDHGYSSNSGAPIPKLSAYGNSCIITNTYNYSMDLKLKATIRLQNGHEYTLSKKIYAVSNNFIGTYQIHSNGTPKKLEGAQTEFVNRHSTTFIYFTNLNGREVWWDENTVKPTSWSFGGNVLSVTFRDHSGPYTFKIGYKDGKAPSNDINNIIYLLNFFMFTQMRSAANTLVKDINPISVNIYDITGRKVHEEKDVINFNIGNTNLMKGVYIIESIDEVGNITRDKTLKSK